MDVNLLEALFTAYFSARKNKRNTLNALAFELHYESNIINLCEDIEHKRYEIAKSICFINFDPVQREIFAADFKDRIVHHLVFNYINPIFDKTFINDSYSCRKNRGTHYGIKRIQRFISQCSNNYTTDCYIMKLDIEGYFMRMDKDILYDKISKTLKENRNELLCDFNLIKYLLQKIIFNNPTTNCIVKGKKSDWNGLPASKSLFSAAEDKGLPIGNLTSQLFGNVYLNDLDHFVKKELKINYYGRYVDDFILIHTNKKYLLYCKERIRKYLKTYLLLNLHKKKFYLQHYTKGVHFLGVYVKPYRIYAGKRIKRNFIQTINEWNDLINKKRGKITKEEKLLFRANINSYLGLLIHYNTYNLRKKMMEFRLDNYFLNYFKILSSYKKVILLTE